ncbi:hypothetical protein DM01DRAFT_1219791 [Hesseltinella vesiculosa]|uniref:histidine kinase n=1 Tax=Hesseltinella vesiculosa TaxID=101127 RepID=A0A1X2GQB7_9FUNG|nr:hypothetical protein DM01DRAFT_1219791 [Hesseltinella vesiculosa]
MSLHNLDLGTVKIPGYNLISVKVENDNDHVLIALGTRLADDLPVIAKLSYQGLRLEREYHIAKRLYRLASGHQVLSQPLEKANLSSGLVAIIFKYEGLNQLEPFHPPLQDNDTDPVVIPKHPMLDLVSFLQFAIQCCNCLEFIHKHQIVHGEVRLSAFLWHKDHSVKLWNFGSGSRSLEANLTSEGWRKTVQRYGASSFIHMLMYMSPEQTGRTTFQPDHRTDLYSIGIVFYVLLTQSLPFPYSSSMEIVHSVLNRKVPAVHDVRPDLPMVLSAIIDKLTNKSPDERYTSAHGLREDLLEIKRQLEATNDPQSISPFNLGKDDIASVFTLPNGCFGRRREVDMVSNIVRRNAFLYNRHIRQSARFSSQQRLETVLPPISNTSSVSSNITPPSTPPATSVHHPTQNDLIRDDLVMPTKRYSYPSTRIQTHSLQTNATRRKRKGMLWKRPTEMVVIDGDSGVGKSTMVRSIQQVARDHGYTAIAKFDTRQPTPYGCILRCLSIFFKNILGESQAEVDRFSTMLQAQLGTQAMLDLPTLLVDNVPELKSFLDPSDDSDQASSPISPDSKMVPNEIGGSEIKMRFHSALLQIFQVMVNFKFVTLFLEDLHQADEASIELLDSLIAARLDLLVIVTFRRDEQTNMVQSLLNNDNLVVHFVHLENMDKNALLDLVRTTMHRHRDIDSVLLSPLVDFISEKTKGNPFYACQLLAALEKKGLIYFTWEQCRWEYNLQEVEKALLHDTPHDDINIEFLVRRLKELPGDGQRFLRWAAFIGDKFSYETVRQLMTGEHHPHHHASNKGTREDNDTDDDEDYDDDILSPLPATTPTLQTMSDFGAPSSSRHSALHGSDAINGLQSALQQGFIHAISNDEFGFSHDRYSQAAMLLGDPGRKEKIHLKIANYFMDDPSVSSFWIADHLRAALPLIKQKYNIKAKYRTILIRAGDRAYHSGAHSFAFVYYTAAHELLSADPWADGVDSNYQETLHLYTQLAEISWFMGSDSTLDLIATILSCAKSAIDRAPAYRLQHRHQWSQQLEKPSHAYILLECLSELGTENPDLDLTDDQLYAQYTLTRNAVLGAGYDNILKMPLCESRLIRTRFSLMEEMCLWAYWNYDTKTIMSISSNMTMKTLSMCTVGPSTGVGLVFFGMASMLLYKDYELGRRMGHIGITLCNQYGGNSECARAKHLYGAFLSPWDGHYRDALPIFHQALKQALLGGDRISATFSRLHLVSGMFFGGEPLADTLREAKLCLEAVQGWHDTTGTTIMVTGIMRAILALQGKTSYSDHVQIFDTAAFNEEEFWRQQPDHPTAFCFYCLKLMIFVLYRHYDQAIELGHKYAPIVADHPSFRHTHWTLFFYCMAMIHNIRQDSSHAQDYQPRIQKYRDLLDEWAQHSACNLQMLVTLIDAELASLENQPQAAVLYDKAIDQAKADGWQLETSVMYEWSGEYYMRQGCRHVAILLLEKAVDGYRHQGCYGKAMQLAQRLDYHKGPLREHDHPHCEPLTKTVEVQTDPMAITPSIPNRDSASEYTLAEQFLHTDIANREASPEETILALDVVDLASILKSSQVISSEMNFELLMKQMLQIVLENSGADSGVIIIKENASFYIMGSGSQDEGCKILKPPQELSEEADSVVSRVTRYAIHAQESILISDIQQDSRFSDCDTSAKSVICTPITHKSAIVGCIYIEGGVGSLTFRHEVVLRLLSQQVGISVTNALLFKSIQKVTYANVKMIENQKTALEEARKSKEAALRAMKLKADFLANMSHELRTPFSGFYGMISLLSETSLDNEQREFVHTAKESCEMLLRIIDDLLNFSKLEAGKVSLDLGPLVVEEVIADTIEILSSLAARKGLELAYIVDADVPKTVIGDSSRVRQILTNLLGNAIKFTHQGGVVIRCHLDREQEQASNGGGDFVPLRFEVIDTGIGIPVEQQRNLFEPFSQVDGSTTRMYGGTGLGLSICLQLVRLMHGHMDVVSQPNQGSNFWFSVHMEQYQQRDPSSENEAVCASLLSQHQKLLLATHHDDTARMIETLLPEFSLDRTSSPKHAVSQALQEQHNILILDIPPKPSSFLAQQLKSVDDDPECDLHIILLYAPATEGHKVAVSSINGASDRRGRMVKMAKPVRRSKLLRAMEQLIDPPKQSPLPPTTVAHPPSLDAVSSTVASSMLSSSALPSPSYAIPSTSTSTANAYHPHGHQYGDRISDYFTLDELDYFKQRPVLIAEDNMVAQKLLRKQLEKMGFTVESANNGEEAVLLYSSRPPNYFSVGFFDHHMPKCDGVEATKRIREMENTIAAPDRLPIIALTADIQASAREVCMNAKMDGYLTKPLIAKQLVATLRELNPTLPPLSSTSSPSSTSSNIPPARLSHENATASVDHCTHTSSNPATVFSH